MKKLFTLFCLLTYSFIDYGQTNSSILNGPINIYPPNANWTSSLNLFNPTKTNQFHITHDVIGTLKFGYDGAGKMTLLGNGNLGLGTYSPSTRLTLADFAPALRFEANANPGYFVEMQANENSVDRFYINVGGDKIFGHKVIKNDGQAHTYVNGRYGIGFSTEVGVPSETGAGVKMFIASNGNVGIGTLTPSAKLEVNGEVKFNEYRTFLTHQDAQIRFGTPGTSGNGVWGLGISGDATDDFLLGNNKNGTFPLWIKDGTGNVGLGNNAPETKLHVTGDVTIGREGGSKWYFQTPAGSMKILGGTPGHLFLLPQGNVGIGTENPTNTLTIDSKTTNSGLTLIGLKSTVTNVQAGANRPIAVNDLGEVVLLGGSVASGDIWTKTGDNVYRNVGNVGIGTTTPSTKLEVNSNVNEVSIFKGTAGIAAYRFYNDINKGVSLFTYKSDYVGGTVFGVGANGSGVIQTANAPMSIGTWEVSQPILFGTNTTERMRISADGNVGIGTASPTQKLHVNGSAIINGWLAGTTGLSLYGDASSTSGIQILQTGNVGIGTTNPTAKLDVRGNMIVGEDINDASFILRNRKDGAFKNDFLIASKGDYTYLGNYQNNAIGFYTGNQERMRIYPDGNIGIGTSTMPTGYKLAVNGDIIAERVVVKLQTNWPDYVFTPSYQRASLPEVEKYINQNHHLPNIPSAQEVADKGIDVGAMNTKMMEKIEELTLYLIEQNKKLEALEKKNAALENAIKNIKK